MSLVKSNKVKKDEAQIFHLDWNNLKTTYDKSTTVLHLSSSMTQYMSDANKLNYKIQLI